MTAARNPPLTAAQAARADAVIFAFAKLWPSCFQVYQRRRRPLMIGIAETLIAQMAPAIQAGRISQQDIKHALARYTGAPSYLQICSTAGATRIGLDGKPVGVVTEEQARSVRGRIAKRKARSTSKQGCRGLEHEGVIENWSSESA